MWGIFAPLFGASDEPRGANAAVAPDESAPRLDQSVEHRPMPPDQRQRLLAALQANAENKNLAILMNSRDTTFEGVGTIAEDEDVVRAIKSVPCHY